MYLDTIRAAEDHVLATAPREHAPPEPEGMLMFEVGQRLVAAMPCIRVEDDEMICPHTQIGRRLRDEPLANDGLIRRGIEQAVRHEPPQRVLRRARAVVALLAGALALVVH